jgi:hypothetical protein
MQGQDVLSFIIGACLILFLDRVVILLFWWDYILKGLQSVKPLTCVVNIGDWRSHNARRGCEKE